MGGRHRDCACYFETKDTFRLRGGLHGFDGLLQARFCAGGLVGVNDVPSAGLVELLYSQAEFLFRGVDVACLDSFAHLAKLSPHRRLEGSINTAASLILAESLFRAI